MNSYTLAPPPASCTTQALPLPPLPSSMYKVTPRAGHGVSTSCLWVLSSRARVPASVPLPFLPPHLRSKSNPAYPPLPLGRPPRPWSLPLHRAWDSWSIAGGSLHLQHPAQAKQRADIEEERQGAKFPGSTRCPAVHKPQPAQGLPHTTSLQGPRGFQQPPRQLASTTSWAPVLGTEGHRHARAEGAGSLPAALPLQDVEGLPALAAALPLSGLSSHLSSHLWKSGF